MKSIIAALLVTTATPTALAAQDLEMAPTENVSSEAASKEMDEMMKLFSKMFDTSKLPPPEPARLKLAETTAARLLPDGSYAKIVNDMLGNFLIPMLDAMPGLSDAQIVAKTGASSEAVAALTPENKEAVTLIIDPNFKNRGDQLMGMVRPIINDVMADLEPALRTGLSRAYARKFNLAELNAINGFFATQAGSRYARESFALQADPEVLQAVFKAVPAMVGKFMGDEAKYKAQFDALPKERKLTEMSDAELQRLASLLGLTVQSLKDYDGMAMTESTMPECALVGDGSTCTDADWAASDAASAAVEAAATETAAFEATMKKQRAAWSKADLKAVEQAEAAQAETWARHEKVDQEVNDAASQLQSAIDTAKRNAGQPVEDEHHDDGMDAAEAEA